MAAAASVRRRPPDRPGLRPVRAAGRARAPGPALAERTDAAWEHGTACPAAPVPPRAARNPLPTDSTPRRPPARGNPPCARLPPTAPATKLGKPPPPDRPGHPTLKPKAVGKRHGRPKVFALPTKRRVQP